MNAKRILCLLLCAVLVLTALSGCDDLESLQRQYQQVHPYDKAFKTFRPEEVMVQVDTVEITWQELFHWIFFCTTSYEAEHEVITDWNARTESGETLAEYILAEALSNALQYAYIEVGASTVGLRVNNTMELAAKDQMETDAAEYDSYKDFVSAIEGEYSTEEYYLYTKEMSAMYSSIYYTVYGEGGAFLNDARVQEYAADDGYLMVKSIQFNLMDPTTGLELTREEKEEKYDTAQWILSQLSVCEDAQSLEERFSELMEEYTEDDNFANYPDGYLFQQGDRSQDYTDAVQALEEYTYTDQVLKADDCYYLLLRIPVNYDVVPLSHAYYAAYGYQYTLRYLASVYLYQEMVKSWATEYPAVFTDAYKTIDLEVLLAG